MKKIVLSLVAITGICSVTFADANMATSGSEESPEDKGFYVSLGYSYLSQDIDFEDRTIDYELDFNAIMLGVGYKFNPYIAVEGRYDFTLGDADIDDQVPSADISVLSLFVKPMYPIAPEMDVYALLGYSYTDVSNTYDGASFDESGFSWGAGASYDVTEEFSVFAEYTRFYDDTVNDLDQVVDSFNVGITYKF